MKLSIKAGATSQTINVFVQDSSSSTGAGLTGLVYNSAGLTAYYVFPRAAAAAITLATLASATAAWSSGGFREIDATNMPGWYRLDVPDAVLASGNGRSVGLHLKGASNMAPLPIEIELTGWDNQDGVRGGMTALPNAAAGANTGLPVVGTQVPNATAGAAGGLLVSGSNAGTTTLGALTITGAMSINGTGNVAQTGDSFVRIGAPVGASISADIAGVQADTDNLQTRIPAALVSGRMDCSVGAMAADTLTASSLAADAVAEIQSGLSTLNAAGVRTAVGLASANLDTQLSAIAGYIDTEVGAIKAKTDNLPSDPADASDIAASFSTVNATLATIAGYVDTEVAAIKVVTDRLATTIEVAGGSPGEFRFTADALVNAPTGAGGSGPTAAQIADAVWDEAITGHLTAGTTGAALNAAGSAGDPWSTPLPGAYGSGTAGKIVGDALDAAVSSRASQTSVDTIDDLLDTEVAAIKSQTDQLAFAGGYVLADLRAIASAPVAVDTGTAGTVSFISGEYVATSGGTVNANIVQIDGENVESDGNGRIRVDVAEVAGAVWDEPIASHAIAGSTGEALSLSGATVDPWATPIPGPYGPGEAGYIVGTYLDAAVSSVGGGSAPTAAEIADEVETRTIAAVAVVNGLAANTVTAAALAADAVAEIQSGLSTLNAAGVRAAVGLASANLDTQIDAIPTAVENADALLNRDFSAVSDTNDRSLLQAARHIRNKWDTTTNPGYVTVRKEDDTTEAWRAALSTDGSAQPITGSDPT